MKLSLKLDPKLTYIISVSGGVDSMVLLDFLWSQKLDLKVVHFNHLKRLDSFKDKELVKNYCLQLKIPFHYFELQVLAKNFQTQARLLRQEKLQQVAKHYQTPYIMTAHHLDDLAETILQKIARGSTLLGYSGMQPELCFQEFCLLKPFLYLSKAEILVYAQNQKVPFLEDSTNQQTIYQRNQIRYHVIPYLKKNTAFLSNIKNFSQQLIQAQTFIRQQTLIFIKNNSYYNNYNKVQNFKLSPFLTLDKIIQKDVILVLLEQQNLNKNFFLLESIIQGLNNTVKPNLTWNLSQKFVLVKSYHVFGILSTDLNLSTKEQMPKKPLLYVSTCLECLKKYFLQSLVVLNLDLEKVSFPLKIRHKLPGDRLCFSFGTQKLKSFLINRKVSLLQRKHLWLIVDNCNNILYIPNLYLNQTLGKSQLLILGLKN
ncbi:MAG: cell cycle protein MesJ [Candidatus Phytoplasma solani]